jgi:16S rRNA (uracil1498-N3)-methyltransferase
MRPRCYCPNLILIAGTRMMLGGEEAHHLVRVRRVHAGDEVEVFDGQGAAFRAVVAGVSRGQVELVLESQGSAERAAPCELSLATAVPKSDRFTWLVEKATELGVARLIPLITERSVVDPGPAKLERLRRVVIEASKQCGRNRLMELAEPMAWSQLVSDVTSEHRWLAHPDRDRPGAEVPPAIGAGQAAVLAVGPEGGFTDTEVSAAHQCGWLPLWLGETILRTETAALAGAAILLHHAAARPAR